MRTLTSPTGRRYESLPLDVSRGVPQTFSHVVGGRTYVFRLHVNAPHERLFPTPPDTLDGTDPDLALVLDVSRETQSGTRVPVFTRRLLPVQEYAFDGIGLYVPERVADRPNLRVSTRHLHGAGSHATTIALGVTSLWPGLRS